MNRVPIDRPASTMSGKRTVSARILISAGAALLILLAAWTGATHPAAEVPRSSVVAVSLVNIAPQDEAQPQLVSPTLETLAGVATCILGALCGLALAFLAKGLLRERPPRELQTRPEEPSYLRQVPVARTPVLTLAQLSLSRT
ncbi:MAG: hypothetical protein DI536_36925 [Archangium gephyra]|uniref:Uncharacterized protein n=1 Tax=Archangium gephyra TaxID=48 RepID=A0A2W5SLC0_9BACT|nr:MAG: hypothetical protein DI536_36925 [Archangium gephyra]